MVARRRSAVLGCRGPPVLTPSGQTALLRCRPPANQARRLSIAKARRRAAGRARPRPDLSFPCSLRRTIAARIAVALGVGSLIAIGAFGLVTPKQHRGDAAAPGDRAADERRVHLDDRRRYRTSTRPFRSRSARRWTRRASPHRSTLTRRVSVELSWDATGTRVTIAPTRGWAPATYHTITVRPGALGASGRPMAVPARAVFLTRAATVGRIEATAMAGADATVSSAFRISFDQPVELGAVRGRVDVQPAARPARSRSPRHRSVHRPSSSPRRRPSRPPLPYTVSLVGMRGRRRRAAGCEPDARRLDDGGAAGRPFPPGPRDGERRRGPQSCRSASPSRWIARARRPPSRRRSAARRSPERSRSPRTTASSSSSRPRLLPYGASIEMLVRNTAFSAAGTQLEAADSVRITVEPKPRPPSPEGGSAVDLERRRGRWRQLGRRRDLLPRAHELHPDRRPRDDVRARAAAPVAGASRRSSSTRASRPRSPARTRRSSPPPGPCTHFSGGNPATGSARPATRATSGPRTSAAARATRSRRSSARISTSRASDRGVRGRPLREPDERQVRPRRDRRLGIRRPGPPRRGLLPPAMTGGPAAMIRNAVIHLLNEQPVLADLFEMPQALDQGLLCTNLRTMDGKRPVFVERQRRRLLLPVSPRSVPRDPDRLDGLAGIDTPARGRSRRSRRGGRAAEAAEADGPRARRGLPPPHPRRLGLARRSRSTAPKRRQRVTACRTRCYTPGRAEEPRDRRVACQGADDRTLPGRGLPGPRLLRSRPRPAGEPRQGQVRRRRRQRLRPGVRHLARIAASRSPRSRRPPSRRTWSSSPPTSTARARRSPGTSPRPPTSPQPRPSASRSARSPRARSARRSPTRARSTRTSSTPSRRAGSSIASSATRSARCCRARSGRPVGRARPVGRRPARRRARAGDRRLHRPRVLDARGKPRDGGRHDLPRGARPDRRRGRSTSATARRRSATPRPCASSTPLVTKVGTRKQTRSPAPPFTTTTLQQEASRKLGFSPKRTMSIAQRLYEGVDTPDGHVGLITYMRTDSTAIAGVAMGEARDVIRGALRRAVHDAEGPRLQDEGEGRPGGARVDPADELQARPGIARGLAQARGAPPLPPHLAARDRLADGGQGDGDDVDRAVGGAVRAARERHADALRRLLAGLHRGPRRRRRGRGRGGSPPAAARGGRRRRPSPT